MNNARENILERIRNANRNISQAGSTDVIKARMHKHARGPRPHWQDGLLDRFVTKATQSAASYEAVSSEHDIITAVSSYLAGQSLGDELVTAGTPLLKQLSWPPEIAALTRPATTQDRVVLVEAFAGIAETGSVVMCSGEQTPVSLNFLPDHFLCVVHKNSIVNHLEDVWEKLRQEETSLPRAINIITGPSRTADVEQIIQMGAHGPRKVHLLLLA